MSVMKGEKAYYHNSNVGPIQFTKKQVLYKKSDYNEDDSIEFRNEEVGKAEAMKIVLKQQMEPFCDEQERLYKNGVQNDVLQDLTLHKLYFETSKIETGILTRRHLYADNDIEHVTTNIYDFDGERIRIEANGGTVRERKAMVAKLNYEARLLKAENPGMSKQSIIDYTKGIRDGFDYSATLQPLTPFSMDEQSQILRAQAMSSCKQLEEFKDKDPNNVFKRKVKNLFGEHGCIPTDFLQKAGELLDMPRYDEKLDRLHDNIYGKGNEQVKLENTEERVYFDHETEYDSE
ncbi:predicted protein [Chaetoceros tenuissimus]|uniref:Uncharacterized protein n=1 Tax=Chaetoceros tenuissimus TaxID=426638 RepID=A0AAD3CIL1_9STRA|nr:predicted protein [Chaetoceros tenuissimus]